MTAHAIGHHCKMAAHIGGVVILGTDPSDVGTRRVAHDERALRRLFLAFGGGLGKGHGLRPQFNDRLADSHGGDAKLNRQGAGELLIGQVGAVGGSEVFDEPAAALREQARMPPGSVIIFQDKRGFLCAAEQDGGAGGQGTVVPLRGGPSVTTSVRACWIVGGGEAASSGCFRTSRAVGTPVTALRPIWKSRRMVVTMLKIRTHNKRRNPKRSAVMVSSLMSFTRGHPGGFGGGVGGK